MNSGTRFLEEGLKAPPAPSFTYLGDLRVSWLGWQPTVKGELYAPPKARVGGFLLEIAHETNKIGWGGRSLGPNANDRVRTKSSHPRFRVHINAVAEG